MKTIFILMDTLNRHMLRLYNPSAQTLTPNIDRLARRSVIFDNHYIGSAPCMPARRDIMTGRLNFLERGWGGMEPFDITLPKLLGKAGIFTHMVTDHYHYAQLGGEGYLQQHTTWELIRGQEADGWISRVLLPQPREKVLGQICPQYELNRSSFRKDRDYPTPRTFAAAARWLRENEGADDFMLTVEAFDPHEPFDASDTFISLYSDDLPIRYDWPRYDSLNAQESPDAVAHLRNRYMATLSMADKWLGKLLDEMDRQNLWDDTCVIFTSDHGHMLGEHNVTGKNRFHAWNEMSRIPLMLHMPSDACSGTRIWALTQNIDLLPTILDLYGIGTSAMCHTYPDGSIRSVPIHGKSWLSLINGSLSAIRDYAVYGWFGQPVNITDGCHTYFRAPADEQNAPLYAYMSLLTGYEHYLGCEHPEAVTTDYYLNHSPIPVYRIDMTAGEKQPPYLDLHINRLYDLQTDPAQLHPLTDPALEAQMCEALRKQLLIHDAPKEQFQRLGL